MSTAPKLWCRSLLTSRNPARSYTRRAADRMSLVQSVSVWWPAARARLDAGVHQQSADAVPPRPRLDQQQPELAHAGRGPRHEEHAARAPPIQRGDPAPVARPDLARRELTHDPRHQPLEALVPPVLLRVDLAVALDHPAEVARLRLPELDGGPRGGRPRRRRAGLPPRRARRAAGPARRPSAARAARRSPPSPSRPARRTSSGPARSARGGGVGGRPGGAGREQAAVPEAPEQPAQIAGVEIQRLGELGWPWAGPGAPPRTAPAPRRARTGCGGGRV